MTKGFQIAVIAGDGIGPEIIAEAKKVLLRVGDLYGQNFFFTDVVMGGMAIDACGDPLPQKTIDICKASDAVLMGSIGGDPNTSPWYQLPPEKRPEAGLLRIRKELNLFANLRPAFLYPELKAACPLKEAAADKGFDLMMVRELTGGLYFGERRTEEVNGERVATDTLVYSESEIKRVAVKAFEIARARAATKAGATPKVTSIDKANVLDSSRLWRDVLNRVSADYPDVTLEHMLVDNCAMQLVLNPAQFDVVVTENMFGDILSDEASMITGSIGMLPSASLNETSLGLYEPSGGSAPDIAGKGIANPLATILSAAMLLRYSLGLAKEADAVEEAVRKTLASGVRTRDIAGDREDKSITVVGTVAMGDAVAERIE